MALDTIKRVAVKEIAEKEGRLVSKELISIAVKKGNMVDGVEEEKDKWKLSEDGAEIIIWEKDRQDKIL